MNATRKEEILKEVATLISSERLDGYNDGFTEGRAAGFEEGRLLGIEEGHASAAALIAGLRSLLATVDGGKAPAAPLPAGLPAFSFSPLETRDFKNPIIDEAVAAAIPVEPAPLEAGPCSHYDGPECFSLGDDEKCGGRQSCADPGPITRAEEPARVSSFKPLLRALYDCDLCGGLGTIPGELYGEPATVPCICKAGMVVYSQGSPAEMAELKEKGGSPEDGDYMEGLVRASGDQPFIFDDTPEVNEPAEVASQEAPAVEAPALASELICFRLNCVSHNKNALNGCDVFANVVECAHQLAGDAIVCANLGCSSFESDKPANCAAIADMIQTEGVRKPATCCSSWMPAPELAGTFDPAEADAAELEVGEWGSEAAAERAEFICCSTCKIADPDCASCELLENEINARNEAEKAPASDPAKCVNRNCTAINPLPGKAPAVCLLIQGKDCGQFKPVEEQGGASGETSQPAEGGGQGAPELSPEEARLLELQKTCKHPKVFIATVPGRGEVCQCCDLVLTPESLPLFDQGQGQAPDAATYFAGGEERREGDTFREENTQGGADPVPCDHPFDFRHRNPDPATGGFVVKCGNCGEVVNRLDAERRSIPRDQWPENKEAGKVVEIASGAETKPANFGAAERKMLAAGFSLALYERPDKENIRLWTSAVDKWILVGKYKKFVDGERALEEILNDPKRVQVNEYGNAATSKDEAKLRAAGFNFYRKEKGSEGVSPKIKDGSKNWGMHSKYRTDAELDLAWEKLMAEDPFALEG